MTSWRTHENVKLRPCDVGLEWMSQRKTDQRGALSAVRRGVTAIAQSAELAAVLAARSPISLMKSKMLSTNSQSKPSTPELITLESALAIAIYPRHT